MSWFEPQISVVRSDRSTNWATTTAQIILLLQQCFVFNISDQMGICQARPNYYLGIQAFKPGLIDLSILGETVNLLGRLWLFNSNSIL